MNQMILLIILTFSLLAFSCNQDNEENEPYKEKVTIGVMMPLTGEGSFWGQNGKKGILLAFDEITSRDTRYEYDLVYEDSKTQANVAVSAFTKLVEVDKINYALVDMISSNVLAIAPIAEKNKIVIISPGASNPKITTAGDYVFRNWPSDALQGHEAARVINNILNWNKVGILKINNDYGAGLSKALQDHLNTNKTIFQEEYEQGTQNFRTQLTKLKANDIDGIYLIAYPQEAPIILKQAKELNITVPFMGTETIENPELIEKAGTAADGVLYTFPESPDTTNQIVRNFKAAFFNKYGEVFGTPADVAYDALYMLINAIEKVGNDPEKVKNYIYTYKNYPGASGLITIDDNGDAIKSFELKIIRDGSFYRYK